MCKNKIEKMVGKEDSEKDQFNIKRKRFMFFYFMKKEPEKIKAAVPLHIEYWHKLRLNKYLGGPFADRTGGLITFEAETIDEAIKLMTDDPFVAQNLLESKWIKEWLAE